MRKFKAFTLVELIVAMAIFGIIMAGVVRMVAPISESSVAIKVGSRQQSVEASITSYLSSTLRYATNIAVIQGGSELTPEKAIKDFKNGGAPLAFDGSTIAASAWTPEMDKNINMIIFDGINDYTYKNMKYKGRLVAMVPGNAGSVTTFSGQSSCKQDGSGKFYEVLGNDYYSQGDYFINMKLTDVGIHFVVDSDYFYNAGSKHGAGTKNTSGTYQNTAKVSSTSHNPTDVWVDLRNRKAAGIDTFDPTSYSVKFLQHKDSGDPEDLSGLTEPAKNNISSTRSEGKMIYIVYTAPNPESIDEFGWWED